jgi:hypothetical protein
MDDWSVKPGTVFAEKAVRFRKDIGANTHPVISRQQHPQQWRDWYAYFGFRKLYASQELMREKDEHTVPTLSPFDFDAEFNPVRGSPEVPSNKPSKRPPLTEAQKERHNRLRGFGLVAEAAE